MLVIPLKCTTRYDLREPLAKWLDGDSSSGSKKQTPANPMELITLKPDFKSHECRNELVRLASLRNCLADSIAKPNSHKYAIEDLALQDCQEYHAALMEFVKRGFPSNNIEDSPNQLQLEWKASIGPQTETHGNLEWDRACIVWNIAALESYLASIQSSDKEGRKQAVKHAQMAACMMRYLHDDICSRHEFATVDFSVPSLKFWESCMLAQAQVAAYNVARLSNTSPKILSYLAMAAVGLFNEALQQSKDPLVVSQLPVPSQEWSVYCKSWSMVMKVKAAHYQALALQQAQSWGMEIASLQETLSQLKTCKTFLESTNNDGMTNEICEKLQIVEKRLEQAQKDNRVIYGETIPTSVPSIVPKQLVKSEMDALPDPMTQPKMSLFC